MSRVYTYGSDQVDLPPPRMHSIVGLNCGGVRMSMQGVRMSIHILQTCPSRACTQVCAKVSQCRRDNERDGCFGGSSIGREKLSERQREGWRE